MSPTTKITDNRLYQPVPTFGVVFQMLTPGTSGRTSNFGVLFRLQSNPVFNRPLSLLLCVFIFGRLVHTVSQTGRVDYPSVIKHATPLSLPLQKTSLACTK